MIKEQSTAKGFTLMSTANLICRCLSILYIPILTLLLGDEGNGIYNAGYVVYLLLFEITYMGIPVAISRMVAKYNSEERYYDSLRTLKLAGALLVLVGIACASIMAIFCNQIAAYCLDTGDAWMTILMLAPSILFTSFSATIRGFFQGQKNMTHTSISQIIEQVMNAVSTPLLAYLFIQYANSHGFSPVRRLVYGAGGAALGTFIGALASVLYLFWALSANYRFFKKRANADYINNKSVPRESNKQILKNIISTAVPIVLGVALVYLANIIDVKFIKSRLFTAGFTDEIVRNKIYGIFSTQYHKVTNIVLGIAATLPATILPGISQVAAKKNKTLLKRKMINSVRASFLITIPCCAGLAIMAAPVIRMLFPGNMSSPPGVVSPAVLIISGVWSIIIVSIVQVLTAVLQGVGDFKAAPINMTIGLVVKLALNYLLIGTRLNIMGAIISTYICYFIVVILDYATIVRRTGIKLNFPKLFKAPLAAAAVMSVVVFSLLMLLNEACKALEIYGYIANFAISAVCIAVGGLVYGIFALKFNAIGKSDLNTVPLLGRILKKTSIAKIVNKIAN